MTYPAACMSLLHSGNTSYYHSQSSIGPCTLPAQLPGQQFHCYKGELEAHCERNLYTGKKKKTSEVVITSACKTVEDSLLLLMHLTLYAVHAGNISIEKIFALDTFSSSAYLLCTSACNPCHILHSC